MKKHIGTRLVSLAIAGAMVFGAPIQAVAVSYNAADGTVHVGQDDDGVNSYQSKDEGNTEKVYDDEIEIKGDDDNETTESDKTIVEVDDDVKDAHITIDGVDNKTKEGSAIEIGERAEVELTIKDTDIKLTDDAEAGISLGDDSETKITLEGDSTITGEDGGEDKTGIEMGKGAEAEITAGEDGGALEITDADTGIDIQKNTALTVDGGAKLTIASTDEDDDDDDEPRTGIKNQGELTVQGEDTEVTLSNLGLGLYSIGDLLAGDEDTSGSVNVSGGASLTVDGAQQAGIVLENHAVLTAGEGGTVSTQNTAEGADAVRLVGQGDVLLVDGGTMDYDKLPVNNQLALADDSQTNPGEGKVYVTGNSTTYTDLAEATKYVSDNDTIVLGKGTFSSYRNGNSAVSSTTSGLTLTFIGQGEETVWNIGADPFVDHKSQQNSDYSLAGSKLVSFKNMKLVTTGNTTRFGTIVSSADYQGFSHTDNTYVEDCIIEGRTAYWGYKTATFKNTVFNSPLGDYAIWTYASPEITFDGCTFNSTGKVINVYADYDTDTHDVTVNFKDCTVNNKLLQLKSVMEINDSNKGDYKYIINISGNNTISGLETGKIAEGPQLTCSKLFGFGDGTYKNSGRTDVSMDGQLVWTNGAMLTHSAAKGTQNPYTDGYNDDAFHYEYSAWTASGSSLVRTVKKICDYCGYTETYQEVKPLKNSGAGEREAEESGYRWYWVTALFNEDENVGYTYEMNGTNLIITTDEQAYGAVLHVRLEGWAEHTEVQSITFVTAGKTTTLYASEMLGKTGEHLRLTHEYEKATLTLDHPGSVEQR